MDYNADVPFEKAPAPGFYDTQDEKSMNEREKEAFDPRKQQLANKRKGDQDDDVNAQETKRRKNDNSSSSAFAAAAKAGQMQKVREAEQSSKRRGLVLPAPQVSESELEDIVKMGMSGDRASMLAEGSENDATKGLLSNYSSTVGATPIRTPRAPQEEDRVANELRNARARTETQSVLLGGDNTPLHEGGSTTGYEGVAPSKQSLATPNPMATPMRNGLTNGAGATPARGPGATPMRTPRDNFALNQEDGSLPGQTPRDVQLREQAARSSLRSKLSALPKPRDMDFELELPEDQEEKQMSADQITEEDAAIRDAREAQIAEAAARAEFKRQTQVVQKGLPRPRVVDVQAMLQNARDIEDPTQRSIAEEMAQLMANDALKFGGAKVKGHTEPIQLFDEEALQKAQMEVILEMGHEADRSKFTTAFAQEWEKAHASNNILSGLGGYADEDELDEEQLLTETFDKLQDSITTSADKGSALEKKLAKVHGGYLERQKKLRSKIVEAAAFLEKTRLDVEVGRTAQVTEEAAMRDRLEGLREEVGFVGRREREAQEEYRAAKEELESWG